MAVGCVDLTCDLYKDHENVICALIWPLINPLNCLGIFSRDRLSGSLFHCDFHPWQEENCFLEALQPPPYPPPLTFLVSQEFWSKCKPHFDGTWQEMRALLRACYLTVYAKQEGFCPKAICGHLCVLHMAPHKSVQRIGRRDWNAFSIQHLVNA